MPSNWATAQLGDLVVRLTEKNTVGESNVLTISARKGLVNQRDYFNKDVASKDLSSYFLLRRGDFAYNKSKAEGYPLGAIKRLDLYPAGVVSPLYICFRLTSEARRACSDFLAHFFESGLFNADLRSIAKEGARSHGLLNVKPAEFLALPVLLPPLAEQRKIAAILSSVDQTIEKTEAVIAQLDVVKKAMLEKLLTRGIPGRHSRFKQTEIGEVPEEWTIVPMESVALQPGGMVGGPFGSDLTASHYVDTPGVPVIRGSDVAPGRFQEHGLAYVSPKKSGDLRKNSARRGDLIMTQRGASLGEAALIPESSHYEHYIVSQTMMRMTPDRSKVLPRFLLHWVCSQPAQTWLQRRAVGNAQPHLNLTIFRAMPAIVPPLPEQKRIADIVDAIDTAIASSLREHAAQRRMKTALGSVLLTGELRVTPSEGSA